MAAVRQWVRELADRELRGSVTAVPVLNLSAFRSRTPFVTPDDGKNLNRCFPGNPHGTFTDRLADAALLDGGRVLQSITAPAPGVPMFVTSSPAVAADGLLLGLGAE
jgi:predicted deacylase